jgi:catalase (peroxidase I)
MRIAAMRPLSRVAEGYPANDSKEKFGKDFVNAWNKMMNLDGSI